MVGSRTVSGHFDRIRIRPKRFGPDRIRIRNTACGPPMNTVVVFSAYDNIQCYGCRSIQIQSYRPDLDIFLFKKVYRYLIKQKLPKNK